MKKILIGSLLIAIVVIAGVFITQNLLINKIESSLKTKLPKDIQVSYSDLKLNLFIGEITVSNLKVVKSMDSVSQNKLQCIAKQLQISNMKYLKYLFNKQIKFGELKVNEPIIDYYKQELDTLKDLKENRKSKINELIYIDNFKIVNGEATIYNTETDSLQLQTNGLNIIISDLIIGKENKNTKLPLSFDEFDVAFQNFFIQVSEYENITISDAKLNNQEFLMTDLKLFTKYGKQYFTKIIPRERDHFTISVDSISINKPKYVYENDTILKVKSNLIVLGHPDIAIYRNKLNTDNTSIKPLYSRMLRNLKFKLLIDSLLIKNAQVLYTERVKIDGNPGEIFISNLNVKVEKLGNYYSKTEETMILAHTNFMKAQTQIDWRFNIHDLNDRFIFNAEIENLNSENLNYFFEPNLNKRLEGSLNKVIFKIDGNNYSSNVDLKVKYDNFKIIALKKNIKEKNKLISLGLNTLVSNTSNRSKDGYKYGIKNDIERDKTKSVFSFILKNLGLGLLKAMTLD